MRTKDLMQAIRAILRVREGPTIPPADGKDSAVGSQDQKPISPIHALVLLVLLVVLSVLEQCFPGGFE